MDDDLLDIVLKYNNVANTLNGRSVFVKDKTMLPFLAYCLISNEASTQVIEAAIDTLLLLAVNECNVDQLAGTFGVLEAVKFITTRKDLPDGLKTKTVHLYKKLNCRDAPAYCTRSKSKTNNVEIDQQPKKIKVIALHVRGLNKDSCQKLESVLIRVKGVVSMVLDVDHQRCTLRVYDLVSPHEIAMTILENTGMEAKLVAQNRYGQEILQPLMETSSNESTDDWPPYLNEEDSPVKDKAISQMFVIKDKTTHWLNCAVGFLQKSFYW